MNDNRASLSEGFSEDERRVIDTWRDMTSDRNLSWVEIVLAHVHFLPCAICAECFPFIITFIAQWLHWRTEINVVFLADTDNGSETRREYEQIVILTLDYVSNGVSRVRLNQDLHEILRESASRWEDSIS